ncbi:MAG: T9SS type A sorting domain-containing protein [Bacteroidia bacterium]
MKKLVTLLFISIVVLSTNLQAQSCPWAKKAGGTSEDNGTAAATDQSGNVYYLGNYYSQNITFGSTTLHNINYGGYNKGADLFLVKYDSCGNFIWAKQAGGNYNTRGKCITTDVAGNVYIGGSFSCDTLKFGALNLVNTGTSTNAFVAKYNSSGIAQWAQGSSGDAQNYITAIALDASNNIYATGFSGSSTITFGTNTAANGSGNSGTYNTFITKFDNTGVNLWLRANTSNGNFSSSGDALGNGIGVDATGNAYITGYFESTYMRFGIDSVVNAGYSNIFLAKYNTSGALQWLKAAGSSDYDEAFGLAADATGNTYITGYIGETTTAHFGSQSITNAKQSTVMFIAKYDNAGNALWVRGSKTDDYTYNNQGYKISLDAGGNPCVIGFYNSDSLVLGAVSLYNNSLTTGGGDDSTDIFVAKYKANGNLSWARTVGGTGNDYGYGITNGPNNSLYITGEFDSPTLTVAGITLTITPGNGGGMGDAFISNNISTSAIVPDICLVSADSIIGNNQYNVIYWDKTAYPTASNFILYREVSTNIYKKIGSQPYATLSEFVDTARSIVPANGDPTLGAYKYTLQILDTSGTYSLMSPFHNTVRILNNSGNFNWNIYTVGNTTFTNTPVSNYYLMRDDNNTGVWGLVGSVTGTQTSLTDPNFSTFQNTANWRVDADGFNCTPTLRLANGNNSTDAAKIKSHSNQANNRAAGINKITSGQNISIYPNPASSNFVVETTSAEKQQLQLIDVTGKIILQQTITGKTTIDANLLSDGVYNISIIGNNGVINKKLVIVK